MYTDSRLKSYSNQLVSALAENNFRVPDLQRVYPYRNRFRATDCVENKLVRMMPTTTHHLYNGSYYYIVIIYNLYRVFHFLRTRINCLHFVSCIC